MLIFRLAVRRRATSVPERMDGVDVWTLVLQRWDGRHQRRVNGGQNGYQSCACNV